jgi:hypothetical protein
MGQGHPSIVVLPFCSPTSQMEAAHNLLFENDHPSSPQDSPKADHPIQLHLGIFINEFY